MMLYLKEWVDFHKNQGVQHFYLYDNFSQDNFREVLSDDINSGTIEIIPWNFHHSNFDEWRACQQSAYTHCGVTFKNETKWCAFIDTDEFLFCPDGKKINCFLKNYKKYQQLLVSWVLYGTGGVKKSPTDLLHKILLFRTSNPNYSWQKCITRLDSMTGCNSCHLMTILDPQKSVNENKEQEYGEYTKNQSVKQIRINHYMFRDVDYFWNCKLKKMLDQGRTDIQSFIDWEADCNQVFDDSILKLYSN